MLPSPVSYVWSVENVFYRTCKSQACRLSSLRCILKIEWSRKRTNQQFIRIGKADICEEFQVIRCFELYAYYREGREPHYLFGKCFNIGLKTMETGSDGSCKKYRL